jgi:DNA repair protein RadC
MLPTEKRARTRALVRLVGDVPLSDVERALRLLRREKWPGEKVDSAPVAYRLLAPGLRGLANEELHVLVLSRSLRPVRMRRVSLGSPGHTIVDPTVILRTVLEAEGYGFILAHNHPSNDPNPSRADVDVTARVCAAAKTLGVSCFDHLVITDSSYSSLAERGELPTQYAGTVLCTGTYGG